MSNRGKTLKGWDAKKGDVFYFNGNSMRGSDRVFDHFCKTGPFHARDNEGNSMVDSPYWHLVSRATPEPDYNDGKWHGWNGGECPVHPESFVEFYAIGNTRTHADKAKPIIWDHDNLIAFRVVKEHKEAREFWIDPNGVKIMFPYHEADDNDIFYERGYIHVREVTE